MLPLRFTENPVHRLVELGAALSRWTGRRPSETTASPDDPVGQVAAKATRLYKDWLEHLRDKADHERLANASAVLRWELIALYSSLVEADLPHHLERRRQEVARSLARAAHAAQLLANGYRFHNVSKVCDGQFELYRAMTGLGTADSL